METDESHILREGRGSLRYPTVDFAWFAIPLGHLIDHLIIRFEGRD